MREADPIMSMYDYRKRFFGPGTQKYGELNLKISAACRLAEGHGLTELAAHLHRVREVVEGLMRTGDLDRTDTE